MKTNYDLEFNNLVNTFNSKKSLLLHVCCGPCSTEVISRLKNYFNITALFYNPNIEPEDEYLKRKNELIKVLSINDISILDIDYNHDNFLITDSIENNTRCKSCYSFRLRKTAKLAQENNFSYFGTTLTVSPSKDSQVINKIGYSFENEYNVKWLPADFKKNDGFLRSIKLSKELNLYRQDYCGCLYKNNI